MADGQGSFNAGNVSDIEIDIDVQMIVAAIIKSPAALEQLTLALIAHDDFIRKLAVVVRNQMLRNGRPYQNIFGKYAGGSQSR